MTPTVFLVAVALVSCVLSQNGHEDCDRGAGRAGNGGNNDSGMTSIDPNGPNWDPVTNGPIDITTMDPGTGNGGRSWRGYGDSDDLNSGRLAAAGQGRCRPRQCLRRCLSTGARIGRCIRGQCRCLGCNPRNCRRYCRSNGYRGGRCVRRRCTCFGRTRG